MNGRILHNDFDIENFLKIINIFREQKFTIPDDLEEHQYISIIESVTPVLVPLNGNSDLKDVFKMMIENTEPNGRFKDNNWDIEDYLKKPNRYQLDAWKSSSIYEISRLLFIFATSFLMARDSPYLKDLFEYLTLVSKIYAGFPKLCVGFKRPSVRNTNAAKTYVTYYKELLEDILVDNV